MMKWKSILFLPLALMMGCETVNERNGNEIDVFPVTFSVSLSKSKDSDVKISDFINKHEKDIFNYGLKIQWFNSNGKLLVNDLHKLLLKNGVNHRLIILSNKEKTISHFDIKLSVTKPKVQVSSCQYSSVYNFGKVNDGCFVENSRWLSMVNPQRMLLEKNNSTTEIGE